jgi:hypothetical protein
MPHASLYQDSWRNPLSTARRHSSEALVPIAEKTHDMSITEQIRKIALELLAEKPEGIRYSELQTGILGRNPHFNKNTISGAIWDLDATFPETVYKADRGIFRLLKFSTDQEKPDEKKNKKN